MIESSEPLLGSLGNFWIIWDVLDYFNSRMPEQKFALFQKVFFRRRFLSNNQTNKSEPFY